MGRSPLPAPPSVVLRGPGQEAAPANFARAPFLPVACAPALEQAQTTTRSMSSRRTLGSVEYVEVRPEGPDDPSPGTAIDERDAEAITLRPTAPPLTAR